MYRLLIRGVVIGIALTAGCAREAQRADKPQRSVQVNENQQVAEQYVARLMEEIDQRPAGDPEVRPALRRLQAIQDDFRDGVVNGSLAAAALDYRRAVEGKSVAALAAEGRE